MVSGLKFLRDHLGFDMSLDDELVSAPADVVPAAPLKQAFPFTARDLWVFETLVHSSNHVQRYLGMAAAVLAYSGIRFKHAQRSKFVSKMNLAWKLSCSKGTSRRARRCPPPFDWAMPIAGVWQATLGDLFFQHWDRSCSRQWTFLVPALRPYRTSLADPTGFAPVPMNTSAWQHILQQFVTLSPAAWGPRTEQLPTTHSGRRMFASAAECMKMPVLDRLALGCWVDTIDSDNSRVPSSMPVCYADESVKFVSQQRVKSSVVLAIRAAVAEHAETCTFQSLGPNSWSHRPRRNTQAWMRLPQMRSQFLLQLTLIAVRPGQTSLRRLIHAPSRQSRQPLGMPIPVTRILLLLSG